ALPAAIPLVAVAVGTLGALGARPAAFNGVFAGRGSPLTSTDDPPTEQRSHSVPTPTGRTTTWQ
ncbi:MAG TPA: hypothetical protein PKA98_20265, partial [Acidimicrobiales bacterium]|nr:hypothetical protein [Acidimicrobiales bacterium]